MKKTGLIIMGLFLLCFSLNIQAQTKSGFEFFAGKWNVVVNGAPQGDVNMFINFEMSNDQVKATMKDSTGNTLYTVKYTEINKDQASITFVGSQGDVNLTLTKKDDNSLTGDIMGMFTVEGKRLNKK